MDHSVCGVCGGVPMSSIISVLPRLSRLALPAGHPMARTKLNPYRLEPEVIPSGRETDHDNRSGNRGIEIGTRGTVRG